nr:reverse transcriptase domain-containing protein [Tanacetum cinerariifolium]
MRVELGSFDVIIGRDWLRRYHVVIVCDEKLVRIPYGNETLVFPSNESNDKRESRLTIISCSKAQEYMTKGCQIFLAQISTKKEEDKSDEKQLKDVPTFRDFPEVFPVDLLGLPPARPVEFQIDLIPGAAPVAQAPGIYVDPAKIESIKDWASSKTPMEIYQFLGLAGYYRSGRCIEPVRVRALVMSIGLDLPKQLLEAHIEALKPKDLENEDVGGMIRKDIPKEKLEPRADGTLCLNESFGYRSEYEYRVSSVNRRPEREDYSNSRGHATVGSKPPRTAKSEPTEARIRFEDRLWMISTMVQLKVIVLEICSRDAPKPLDTKDHIKISGPDMRPRPAVKTRPAKKTKSKTSRRSGGSASGSISDFVSEDLRHKLQARTSAYEAKKQKEMAIMEFKEMKFLKIDPDELSGPKASIIRKNKNK